MFNSGHFLIRLDCRWDIYLVAKGTRTVLEGMGRISGIRAEIRTRDVRNTEQKCKRRDGDITRNLCEV